MNILIIGINYAPEMVGIGPYTAGMAEWLTAAGHKATVICAKPYYPQWKIEPAFKGGGTRVSVENGVRVVRLPVYVPSNPSGKRRVLHHINFALRAELAAIAETRRAGPDVIIGVAPSLISMIAAHNAARRTGAKFWLHIQDFEVEAAFATGLLNDTGLLAKAALCFESWAIKADRVSTISPQMCAKLAEKGIRPDRIVEFRNWANLEEVVPLEGPSPYRKKWSIERPFVAVYSGNIANKQGTEIIVEAAKILHHRKDLTFLICGNGPNQKRLLEQSAGLDNIQFQNLQPRERLSELLGIASVHLLPQIAGAEDLVLPSKLANMLASGRPIVATANIGTGIANELAGCGVVTPPGHAVKFAQNIEHLLNNESLRNSMAAKARDRALERWSQQAVLNNFLEELREMTNESTL